MLYRALFGLALCCALAVGLSTPHPADAQDKDAIVKGAKAVAVANLKKANIDKPTVVETANYLVAGALPPEKAKALGEALEKATAVARKALKFDDKEAPWKGKLTVYFMPDSAEYKALMRRAFQVAPEGIHSDLRADPPFLVDPAEAPAKTTDAELYFNTAARIAGEHLKGKGTGTQNVPDWLRDGFGRVTAMRAEGTTARRYTAYRTQARAAIAKGAKLDDVWGEAKSAANDVLGQSLAEYLTFGPGAAKFPMILSGLMPSENNDAPTFPQALEAAGLREKDKGFAPLEAAWRKWAAGK
ncbi:hypothetical protein GobsT_45380 [Gemmata obscuriglobus]|uniref:Uncharacterized protein n=1 Tax=Gemmata obscuriglobus TaxID=114 RepID=A0A2Z3GXX3_9BACT|nr:hypothetical protein [Gemmata obscuriglobus]AWM37491.1 hypothetical protein C1280_11005 [Gemmata obscuriglobus]QEG29740.1 hypothetical protein GobsT_45380 [Gemmata obscuriglobus]VTS09057.1 unnamed protein product [Gemmata obscuriglobus UQM 2246]